MELQLKLNYHLTLNTPVKVLIADDHTIVRNGIVSLLEKQKEINVIAEAKNGEEVLEYLKSGINPEVVITDLNMPKINGSELAKIINEDFPNIRILILTILDQDNYVTQAFNSGAHGYLLKNANIAEVVFAIRQIAAGYNYLSTEIGMKLLFQQKNRFMQNTSALQKDFNISNRELEILSLIAEGYTNSEIAEKLFTSKRTIEGNRQSLLTKTGQKNTASLINFVIRNGLLD